MQPIDIQNRHGQRFIVNLYPAPHTPKGLVFMVHGFSGAARQPHIHLMSTVYQRHGYTVLSLDCTNSFNDSDGSIETSTINAHLSDLEDAVNWAKTQDWYTEPFGLAGHSLGGMATLLYAGQNPDIITHIAPTSSVINRPLWEKAQVKYQPDAFQQWQDKGYFEKTCSYAPEKSGRVMWSFTETLGQHDVMDYTDHYTMPMLAIVGADDIITPAEQQKMLVDVWSGSTTYHVIENCAHTFKSDDSLRALENHLSNWLEKIG